MKHWKTFVAAAGLLCVTPYASAALILEYKFNETGTSAASTGTDATPVTLRDSAGAATDLHGAASSGVSGSTPDRAFDNTASTGMGFPNSGGYANQADNNAIDSLTSLTLAGWYKAAVVPVGGARLASKFAAASGFELYATDTSGQWNFVINGTVAQSTVSTYTDLNTWVFFAATYDGSNIRFYKGTDVSSVSLINTVSAGLGTIADNTAGLAIGNYTNPGVAQRPFDGLLDNIRIYGATSGTSGALNTAALEALRVADLVPVVVPEPASLALVILGGGLLFVRRRSRTQ